MTSQLENDFDTRTYRQTDRTNLNLFLTYGNLRMKIRGNLKDENTCVLALILELLSTRIMSNVAFSSLIQNDTNKIILC